MIYFLYGDEIYKDAFELSKRSYLAEAKLIGFDDLPPLKESFEQFLDPTEFKIGYDKGNQICGFMAYHVDNSCLRLEKVAVDPLCFRQGIAKALFVYLEKTHPNITCYIVHAAEKNIPALRLYESCGYVEYDRQAHQGIVMVELRKVIDPTVCKSEEK